MKKIIIVVILILILFLCTLPWTISEIRSLRYRAQQKQLAEIFEVDLKNYRVVDFPYQYLAEKLQPGMSTKEIHQIVRGYTEAFKCKDWAEVYFYFSSNEEQAFKYKMLYENGQFESFITDDGYNSMGVSINGCERGLLDE